MVLPVLCDLGALLGPRDLKYLLASKGMKHHKQNLGCKEIQGFDGAPGLIGQPGPIGNPEPPEFPGALSTKGKRGSSGLKGVQGPRGGKMDCQDHQDLLDCQEHQGLTIYQGRKDVLAKLVLELLPVFRALEGSWAPGRYWASWGQRKRRCPRNRWFPRRSGTKRNTGWLLFVEGLEHLVLVALLSK